MALVVESDSKISSKESAFLERKLTDCNADKTIPTSNTNIKQAEDKKKVLLNGHNSSSTVCDSENIFIEDTLVYKLTLAAVWLLTAVTRLYNINKPAHICWDETHFGKFANHYLNGTFFFDVHPPLGKMLLAMAGWVTGYNGQFPFDKPGDQYGEHNYVGMRVFCAILGGSCIPLAYLIVWELTHSLPACILAACLIIFDNGCVTISQYILLDPILMFFMMMSVFSLMKFYSWRDCPFSFDWWGWMLCTGYFLACTFSVKWVGLFVILFVGLTTIHDMWQLLGDLTLPIMTILKHFLARVIGLIILPITVYLFFFGLHFQSLPYSGPGDGFFSSSFQSTLQGNQLYRARLPGELAYGAVVTLKNYKTAGVLLHSHHHLYPKEHPPEQQQITGYSHKDSNNDWMVHKPNKLYNESDPVEYVYDGDIIVLQHVMTKRNLHSHREKAPISKNLQQVSGYGENGVGDANDYWRIEIYKNPGKNGRVSTVKTVFKLIHVNTKCALQETDQLLPKWGWEQREMACNPNRFATGTTWNVEGNVHKKVPEVSIELLAPSFLESVYESHVVMLQTNNGFKPKEGEFTSQAWHWPINYRGQAFSGGDERIYLLGNPIIWWFILSLFFVYVFLFFTYSVVLRRGYQIHPQLKIDAENTIRSCGWLLLGWSLHYFPFFAMGRVLYFHHYFPAYLFSAMFSGILLEHLCRLVSLLFTSNQTRDIVYSGGVTLIVGVAMFSFYIFRGLSYGMSGPLGNQPNRTQAAYRWLDTWDI
ncbi:protein O-mannosyl-transferase 2 isoform X2 [Hydra vulgaris]|uniref:Protein O-mannosyl-transferase 2 n=1 Tax=Hydra vulgaris TaxID=6087 RepID=T2M3L9_HYDVU|nr:protein O-mannosyl-transferase 2 isoform X2 [Hydra vulgaris]